jgi:hypothetical protein
MIVYQVHHVTPVRVAANNSRWSRGLSSPSYRCPERKEGDARLRRRFRRPLPFLAAGQASEMEVDRGIVARMYIG